VNAAKPQQQYQVRFDVGLVGFQALAGQADVVILADALPPTGDDSGIPTPLAAHRVIAADLGAVARVADWVLARQAGEGERLAVAVIAVGERRNDGTARFAVEDFLVAGAVIDALAGLGIDHVSPEAAAAAASFTGLRQAIRHLVSASETALALVADGRQAEVTAAVAALAGPGADPQAAECETTDFALLWEFTFPA
jgi:2-phosphosulfolactate phosphatase